MRQTQRKGLGGFDKALIGCGIGCAAVILVTLLGVAFGTLWVFTPGKQAATDAVADDASLGVIRLHELADDAGTQELITRVLERLDEANRRQQREQLPEGLRWVSDLQARQSDPRGLNMMIPRDMTIAFEADVDGEDVDYVVAFNPRAMVRLFKGMLGLVGRAEGQEIRSDHSGHPVYRLDEGSHLAFVGSTVLFASSRRAVERAVDRIAAADADGASAPGVDLAAKVPEGDWDVEGIVGNEAGLVDAFLAAHAIEPAGEDPGAGDTRDALAGGDVRMGFGFDIVSAEEISGRTVLECADHETAKRLRAALETRHAETMEAAATRGLELEIESRVEGGRVVIDLRLVGLGEVIANALTFDGDDDAEAPEE